MKDAEHIEEMLNSYIDGELDERGANEVKRLLDNDSSAKEIYESLQRYKSLIATAEQAPVPAGLSESITKQLERQVLLAGTDICSHKSGSRHLAFRKIATIAAIAILGAALISVVFDIFVPKSSREKIFSGIARKQTIKQTLYEKPFDNDDTRLTQAVKAAVAPVAGVPMTAKLNFHTERSIEADWSIAKMLSTTGLFGKTASVERQSGAIKYVLNCSNKSLVELVSELQFIWPYCSDVSFAVENEQFGSHITINHITAEQVLEICRANSFEQRIRMAKDMSVINEIVSANALKRFCSVTPIDYETILSQKPALTSSQSKEPPSDGPDEVTLTINVINK